MHQLIEEKKNMSQFYNNEQKRLELEKDNISKKYIEDINNLEKKINNEFKSTNTMLDEIKKK